jgi:hypothetical protein
MTRNKRGKEENEPHGNPGCEGEAILLVGYRLQESNHDWYVMMGSNVRPIHLLKRPRPFLMKNSPKTSVREQ